MGSSGVVAAGDARTARVGAQVLAAGGNAVDAAVASVLAAFVAEPVLTGPFGGGFALACPPGGVPEAHDFFAEVPGRGLPPAAGDPALDFAGLEVSFGPATQVFHVGRGAVAVPLLLPGLVALHRASGRLPLRRLVDAVRPLAAGVALSAQVGFVVGILEPILRHTREAEALFAPGGRLLGTGDVFRSPDLVRLLDRVAAGEPAPGREALLSAFGPPAGRLTAADLDAAEPLRGAPLRVTLPGGHEVHLTPPVSAGGLLVAFGLRLLEAVRPGVLADEEAAADHLLAALAVTAAARADALDAALVSGDDLGAVGARFLSDAYLDGWREPFARAVRDGPTFDAAPEPAFGSTTHVSVTDADGGACAITTSNGEGCGHLVPGAGALANNFLGEEDLHPGGFHRRPPGARLTSMMCPTLVSRGGVPELTLGSGGSNRIRSALLQVLAARLLAGRPLEDAVGAPRMHVEGRTVYVERRGPSGARSTAVMARLARRAPELVVFETPNMFFGGVHAAGADGEGAGDLRRGGAVAHPG